MATMEILDEFGRGGRHVTLGGDQMTIGRNDDCSLVIEGDMTVSRLHAVLEPVGIRWAIRDAGSANGTFVNHDRVVSDQLLRDGDEVHVGRSALRYRNGAEKKGPTTDLIAPPPTVTKREFDVLRELVRPIISGNRFVPPSSTREISEVLFVGEAAVKAHLASLYVKFGIDEGPNRRHRLATEAIERGAVTFADLMDPAER